MRDRLEEYRTTSACAENTRLLSPSCGGKTNYLRVRGEYCSMWIDFAAHSELPPRARRILTTALAPIGSQGTTSACAENTPQLRGHRTHTGNYLRVRGEYLSKSNLACLASELPPRARRIRRSVPAPTKSPGTTSACAENTLLGVVDFLEPVNYLRVRGEYPK